MLINFHFVSLYHVKPVYSTKKSTWFVSKNKIYPQRYYHIIFHLYHFVVRVLFAPNQPRSRRKRVFPVIKKSVLGNPLPKAPFPSFILFFYLLFGNLLRFHLQVLQNKIFPFVITVAFKRYVFHRQPVDISEINSFRRKPTPKRKRLRRQTRRIAIGDHPHHKLD